MAGSTSVFRNDFRLRERAFLVAAHQAAIAGDIRRQHRRQSPFHALAKDGRFSYEAAGDPALPPLVFLHGIGGAARAWRGQLDFFRSLSRHRLGHAGLWRIGAAGSRQHCLRSPMPCRISCSRSARRSPSWSDIRSAA
jgi:pimeloyl-ACP methyl ester carboxylesterase